MFKYIIVHKMCLYYSYTESILIVINATRVFYIAAVVAILFIIWGVIPDTVLLLANLDNVTSTIQGYLVCNFGWYYLITATVFLLFAIYLIFSPYGNIKLG